MFLPSHLHTGSGSDRLRLRNTDSTYYRYRVPNDSIFYKFTGLFFLFTCTGTVPGSNLQKSCFTFCSIFTKEEACHPLYPGPVPPLMQSITVFCTMCHSFCNVTMGEPRCSLGPDKGPRLSPLLLNVLLQLLFRPSWQDVHLKNKIKMRYSCNQFNF